MTTKIVREFSTVGPCITVGRLVKETEQFFVFDRWQGGDRFEGRGKIRKRSEGRYSRAHIEPCCSCRDHAKTQYPEGYMD